MLYQYEHLGTPEYLKIETGQDFNFPLHLHQCFEIIILLEGQMEIQIGKKSHSLQKGQAALIFPHQLHSLSSQKSRHLLCIFSPDLIRAFSASVEKKRPETPCFSPSPALIAALEGMQEASLLAQKGVLYSLCAEFNAAAIYREAESDRQALLPRIFRFVEERFAADCSLSALSSALGYDYAYLSRFFKGQVGISFNNYVTFFRLSHACYLLLNTRHPIITCAFESGFSSLGSFNQNFKKNLGKTPAQYRKDPSNF